MVDDIPRPPWGCHAMLSKTWEGCYSKSKSDGGFLIQSSTGEVVIETTDGLSVLKAKGGMTGTIPDEDLVAIQVYGRCRFMWDTSSFKAEAPIRGVSKSTLSEEIAGHLEDGEFYADAVYVGYSMYVEGPVFATKVRKGMDNLELRTFSFQGNEFRVEPGSKDAGMAVVPHFGATTKINLLAMKAFANGSSAAEAFGTLLPLEEAMEQAGTVAQGLADGRAPRPVMRMSPLRVQGLPEGSSPKDVLRFPNKAEGFDNPSLTELVCDATLLSRGCPKPSGYIYRVPYSDVLEYPDRLLAMLRAFAQKYTKDRLTERGMLLAAHLWVNITEDPDNQLELFVKQQRSQGQPYQAVPIVSLAHCLIYFSHWVRWVLEMSLVEFVHPFRFVCKAAETDVANNPDLTVEANDIDQDAVRKLMAQVTSMLPAFKPYHRLELFPTMMPGSNIPPLCRLTLRYPIQAIVALSGLEHMAFFGLPSYETPKPPHSTVAATESTRPGHAEVILTLPKWAKQPACRGMGMPYAEFKEKYPAYSGYPACRRWPLLVWKDSPVRTQTQLPFLPMT